MALPMPPIQTSVVAAAAASSVNNAPSTSLVDVAAITTSATNNRTALQPSNFINTSVIPATTNTNAGINMDQSLNFVYANTIATVATAGFHSPLIIDSSANLFQLDQKPSVLPLQVHI